KHVQSGELFPNLDREGVNGGSVFNIELPAEHAGAGGSDFLYQMLPTAGNDDLIAASVEVLGKGASDTTCTASDEDGVPSEMHSSHSLSLRARTCGLGI